MAELVGILDANLIATGLVSSRGPGSALITAARLGRFVLVVSDYLLAEVRDTLIEDFHQAVQDVDELVGIINRVAEHLEPATVRQLSRDPDDDQVLALAEESGAAFLATYDRDVMAVGSVGGCGVVHPITALQLVAAATVEDQVEGVPGVSHEDRSQWRYEDFGAPLVAALRFIEWARQLPASIDDGSTLTTEASWSRWREQASDGTLTRWVTSGWGWSVKVRYPADGMAYVFCPHMHPEETEPVLIAARTAMKLDVITLLDEDGEWRVHSVGQMVPPSEVRRAAYSW